MKIKATKTTKPKAETANRITANIMRVVNMYPKGNAARVNTVGIWDAAKGVYRRGNSTKGVADIVACINGRHVELEVKAGKDKPSLEQLQRQQEIRRAGGVYEFICSTDAFTSFFNEFIAKNH